jgi:HNH endonuclease
MTPDLVGRVRARAKDVCVYCRLPQSASPLKFHIEHVIARQHGGNTTLGNLALSCPAWKSQT